VDYASLVDARVSVRGNVAPLFNYHRQLTGSHLFFPNLSTLRVEEAAPANPFEAPLEEASDLLQFTPGAALNHRAHIRGTVTLLWPGRTLCVQDGSHGLCADTSQYAQLSLGDEVDVIGFPAVGEFTPTLIHANFRTAAGHQSLPPLRVTAEEAMQGLHDAEVVSVQGRLIGRDRTATDPTIVLSSGNVVFTAVLPSGSRAAQVEEGSLVTVTGICSLESKGAATTAFPVARSMRILLRSPSDIVVLRWPSWWNAEHALMVLAVALASTVAALVCALSLWRRVKRQTLLLKKSEEQFRYLASQDSLTRLPNRSAILKVLSTWLESARENRGVCVAIVDLDHFKRINDTYGHLAGDEVLRQAAFRLASNIRTSDAIGRYGGEEFLIVLRDVDCKIGLERCESIRCAMSCEPISFDNHTLPITCSIGVAYTDADSAIPTALIAQADEALYKAKMSGRDRVELCPPELAITAGDGSRFHSLAAPR
jgi:diguanylate cyclase (GGDEF)-like protein